MFQVEQQRRGREARSTPNADAAAGGAGTSQSLLRPDGDAEDRREPGARGAAGVTDPGTSQAEV